MQFPVPQFTEVEDKIIGPLTLKQFGIIFGGGVIVFLAYSSTKSVVVLIFFAVVVGLPALAVAFGKINGRPMYNAFAYLSKFISSPKIYVFHKEVNYLGANTRLKDTQIGAPVAVGPTSSSDTKSRLKEINRMLQEQDQARTELLKKK